MALRTEGSGLAEYSFNEGGQQYWVRPVILLPTADGHPFLLAEEQGEELTSIESNLTALLDATTASNISMSNVDAGVNGPSGIQTQLTALLADIATIKTIDGNLLTSAGARNTLLTSLESKLTSLDSGLNGQSGVQEQLTDLLADVAAIELTSDGLLDRSTSINTTLTEIDATTDAINTSTTAINAATGTINTNAAAIKAAVDAIQASLNPTTPNLINIFLVANTQKSVVIPSGAKRWSLKCRGDIANGDILIEFQVSYTSNMAYATAQATLEATGYDVVGRNSTWIQENVSLSANRTIYLKAASAVVLAMEYWT